jgi:hypothetical protein
MNKASVIPVTTVALVLLVAGATALLMSRVSLPIAFPCPSNPRLGVWRPERLHVLRGCVWFSGTVMGEDRKADGDLHVLLRPESNSARFLDSGDRAEGGMVVEIMPGQTLPTPSMGERLAVFGTWVYDRNHRWNEIHPVWGIVYGRTGTSRHSLPPATPRYSPPPPKS